jgi:hypothetical protein
MPKKLWATVKYALHDTKNLPSVIRSRLDYPLVENSECRQRDIFMDLSRPTHYFSGQCTVLAAFLAQKVVASLYELLNEGSHIKKLKSR